MTMVIDMNDNDDNYFWPIIVIVIIFYSRLFFINSYISDTWYFRQLTSNTLFTFIIHSDNDINFFLMCFKENHFTLLISIIFDYLQKNEE